MWFGLFFVMAVVIVILLVILIKPGSDSEEVKDLSSETSIEIDEAVEVVPEPIAFEEIDIFHNDTRLVAGFARRGTESGSFTHVMVVDVPAIDPAIHYYEGWLVEPGVTEFFSTGALFAREDGKFGLIYEVSLEDAPNDIFDYTRVVVTRELFDSDDGPSPAHIAEGEFLE